jgi:hypothetical protein
MYPGLPFGYSVIRINSSSDSPPLNFAISITSAAGLTCAGASRMRLLSFFGNFGLPVL